MKRTTVLVIIILCSSFAKSQITPLLFENFNNGFPVGWQVLNEDGLVPHASVAFVNDAWVVAEAFDSTGVGDSILVGTSYYVPAGTASDWLFLPPVTLLGNGNILQWQVKSQDPSYPDGYQVLINTSAAVKDSFDVTDPIFTTDFELPVWTTRSVELDSFAGQTVYIAFRLKTTDHFLLLLDDIYMYSDSTLSTEELKPAQKLAIEYPNPASDVLYVDYYFEDDATYSLLDMSGRVVLVTPLKAGRNVIAVSQLQAGTYLSRINSSYGQQNNRIILR